MARFGRKRRGGSRKAKSIPVAIAAPLAYIGADIAKLGMNGDWKSVGYVMTGVKDGKFDGGRVLATYGPTMAGVVVHKVANKVGLNNYVRRATMGYLSI